MFGRFLFRDDNARRHKRRIIMELHENHMQYACMGWLASSPEIEIIEHDWDMLVRWTEFTNIEESTLSQQIALLDIPQLPT